MAPYGSELGWLFDITKPNPFPGAHNHNNHYQRWSQSWLLRVTWIIIYSNQKHVTCRFEESLPSCPHVTLVINQLGAGSVMITLNTRNN